MCSCRILGWFSQVRSHVRKEKWAKKKRKNGKENTKKGRFCIEEQLGVTQCQSSACIVLYSIAMTIGSRLGGCCPAKDRYGGARGHRSRERERWRAGLTTNPESDKRVEALSLRTLRYSCVTRFFKTLFLPLRFILSSLFNIECRPCIQLYMIRSFCVIHFPLRQAFLLILKRR